MRSMQRAGETLLCATDNRKTFIYRSRVAQCHKPGYQLVTMSYDLLQLGEHR